MTKLKLGKLPDRKLVKLTFPASVQLKKLLDQYAEMYETVYGSKEKIEDLIPAMLEGFMKSDAGFRKVKKEKDGLLNRHPRDRV